MYVMLALLLKVFLLLCLDLFFFDFVLDFVFFGAEADLVVSTVYDSVGFVIKKSSIVSL